jgi:hypothetical protein
VHHRKFCNLPYLPSPKIALITYIILNLARVLYATVSQAPKSSCHFLPEKHCENGLQTHYVWGLKSAILDKDPPQMEAPCKSDNMKVGPQKQIATCQQNLLLLFITSNEISTLNDMDVVLQLINIQHGTQSQLALNRGGEEPCRFKTMSSLSNSS